jgi:outer membrane protein assembly factor BamA
LLALVGAESITDSGLGFVAGYDSRDNQYTATSGIHTDLEVLAFGDWIGSDHDYQTISTFFDAYWSPKEGQVLAARFRWRLATGDVPFSGQSTYGGADLRGYATGKYRGNGLLAGQVEYRVNIWERVGAVVFGGSGRVYGGEPTLGANQVLPSGGGGVRFLLLEDRGATIGLDYAVGKDGNQGFYFHFGEAF